jgi:hypothetical protein
MKSCQQSAVSIQLLEKGCEHSLYFSNICGQSLVVGAADETQVVREQKVVFKLAGRTHRDLKEPTELHVASPPAPLGDVGGNGGARAASLTRQPIHLLPRKTSP